MNPTALTRRSFLGTSTGIVAILAGAAVPGAERANPSPEPAGVVYGRAGERGIPAGADIGRSRGEVILLDGRVLEASHVAGRPILPGRGVLLSPDGSGGWSVLYAEY